MDKFDHSEKRITPPPRRSVVGYTARSRYPRTPKSPSTDSTTSLAQLHAKLHALTPMKYDKVPQKISATPNLSTVREVSERHSRLGTATRHNSTIKSDLSLAKKFTPYQNDSESKISLSSKRVQGYQSETEFKTPPVETPLRAYQSDTEAKTVVKRSRCISPVNKENSAGPLLVAALGTSDESVINDTHDRLCKDNPQYDLCDIILAEALQNDQEKDSGVCSKITQASDVVENTPIEKNVQRNKFNINRSKQTVRSNSATDESTTDVIDDTPCYVYDRKKRVQTNTKKASNVITEDVNAYDAAAETFFSQHMNENNGRIYISPTLAKKINETSSEASDDDLANITVLHEEYFDVMSYFKEVVDKEIVECLNSMIDKVCSGIDKWTNLMDEKHQHADVLSKVQQFEDSTKNNLSLVDDFEEISDTKKVTLKFNFSKKRVPKMNKKQKNPKNVKQPVKVHEDNVIIENAEVKSPERTTKKILTRKKRKLYSPKDDDNDYNEITRTTLKDESRQSIINKTPIATCYKELEKARRSRIRKSRAGSETITSPKTKNLNDLFDKIKENVENEETVILVDKPKSRNKNDLALYNLSSESDDQNFKETKIKVQKRVSSSSLESSAKKRSRVVKPKQFSDNEFCDLYSSEDESNMIKKHKIVKKTKPRSRKVKKEQNLNLIDERMRQAPPEVLETSFIKETVNEGIAEVEPAIQEIPVLETMPDDVNDVVTEDIVPENKSLTPKNRHIFKVNYKGKFISRKNEKAENKTRTPNTLDIVEIKKEKAISQKQDKAENKAQTPNISDIVKIKKEKAIIKKNEKVLKSLVPKRGKVPNKRELNENISKGQDSATVSPLPGLVVETEQLRTDDMTSSIEANLLQKFKNIYTEVHDLSDTQNLILNENNYNDADGDTGFTEQIETLEVSDSTERSIDTVGRSPITAHNDLDEMPPNVELLHEEYHHRDVNIEGISRDIAEFLDTMRSQFTSSRPVTVPVETSPVLPTRTSSKRSIHSIKKQNTTSAESHTTDPVVVLKRLSSEEIETNLNPAKTRSRTSQISSSKVLSRKSSAEIEKYRSPHTKTSSSTRSPQVLLDRLSSKDIDKWLPIPKSTFKDATNDKTPKKPKKKEITKKLFGITKTTTGKVIISPSSDKIHEKKLKSKISNSLDKSQENKFKSMISPVKLDFCFENTNRCLTRSSIKSTKSNATKVDKNKDEEIIHVTQESSNTAITEKCIKENVQQKTQISVQAINTTDILRKDKTKRLPVESNVNIANLSDNSENTAMVQDWFRRNASASTSGKADYATVKDILEKVTESLETTLTEMHQSIREKLILKNLETQKQFKAFKEDVNRSLDEMDKNLMEGAKQVLREDAEKKALMVRLLKQDIQIAMDFVDKTNK